MSETSNEPTKRAIVIGSGFGGAVTACRLVQAARQKLARDNERWEIVLLERGRKYAKEDFPRLQLPEGATSSEDLKSSQRLPDMSRFSWRTDYGLFDTRNLGGLMVVQSAGFGGGSLIYANVMLRAPESELEKWPAEYAYKELEPYYKLVEWMLRATLAPNAYPKTRHFEKAVKDLKRDLLPLPLAVNFPSQPGAAEAPARNGYGRDQGKCNGCGDCVIGCSLHAKNTLDLNYLARVEDAQEHQLLPAGVRDEPRVAKVWTMAEVTHIYRQVPDATAKPPRREFRVHVTRHDQGEAREILEADYVFLAAGAIGTTELLLHNWETLGLSKTQKEQIGQGLFGNGDSLGVVFDSQEASTPWTGPTITRGMIHVEQPKDDEKATNRNGHWFLIQDGGIPPSLRRVLGYFHSGMWLGRNRFKAPASNPSAEQERVGPLTDLFVDLPLLTGLFKKSATPPPPGKDPAWQRYLPPDFRPFIKLVAAPQERLIREVKALDTLVLKRVQAEFGRRFGLASWLPGLREVINQDLLLESVLGALRERYKMLGYLPKSGSVVETFVSLGMYMLFGHGPSPNSAVLLCMGPDDAWTLRERDGRLRADRDRQGALADTNLYGTQERVLRDLAEKLGGELRTNPSWTIGKRPITVHAQGGSGMAVNRTPGVTNEWGRVHGCTLESAATLEPQFDPSLNLFVMDAAGFPASVGVNPSLTIAAVAERKVEAFIRATMGLRDFDAQVLDGPPPGAGLSPSVHVLEDQLETTRVAAKHEPIGLKWREWMDGSSAPTEAERTAEGEPKAPAPNVRRCIDCESHGLREGRHLALVLDCQVEELERFYLEQKPKLTVSGTITLRGVGRDRSVVETYDCQGELRLEFQRERMVRMRYVLGLIQCRADGKTMDAPQLGTLHGVKFLSDDAGLDSFLDLTTLYTTITWSKHGDKPTRYEAGVVRVPAATFLSKQMPTFELTGSSGMSEVGKVWAAARFADFFLSGVKQTYLPELFVKKFERPAEDEA